jgi:hypothetical protein
MLILLFGMMFLSIVFARDGFSRFDGRVRDFATTVGRVVCGQQNRRGSL